MNILVEIKKDIEIEAKIKNIKKSIKVQDPIQNTRIMMMINIKKKEIKVEAVQKIEKIKENIQNQDQDLDQVHTLDKIKKKIQRKEMKNINIKIKIILKKKSD